MISHVIYSSDDSFGPQLLQMCNQALFECLALNLHCLRGDQRALTAVINHRIVSTQCFTKSFPAFFFSDSDLCLAGSRPLMDVRQRISNRVCFRCAQVCFQQVLMSNGYSNEKEKKFKIYTFASWVSCGKLWKVWYSVQSWEDLP